MSDELRKMGMEKAMHRYFGENWREIVGMPPEQPQTQMPPGMMPPMMPGMMPPMGPPPSQSPMQGAMGMPGGMAGMPAPPPDVQAGMISPEMLGLPPNAPAELFQAVQGAPVVPPDEQEILRAAGA